MKRIDKRLKKQLKQVAPSIPAKTGMAFDETLNQIKEKQIRRSPWFSACIVLVYAVALIFIFLNLKTGLWDEEKNRSAGVEAYNSLTDARTGKIIEEPQIEEIESIRVGMIDYRNPEIRKFMDMILAQFKKERKESQKSSTNCEVIANTERWFTLRLVVQEEKKDVCCYYYNVDRKSCQIVELPDLFVQEFDYVDVFSENIREQLKEMLKQELKEPEEIDFDIEGYFSKITKNQEFYFNQKGNLVLVFEKGEAAPEEMGYLKFVIEKEVFEAALK